MTEVFDIKALRQRLGWTQGELAEWLGVAACSVSRMESKGRVRGPTLRLLKALAEQHGMGDIPRPDAAAIDDREGAGA